MSEFKTLSDLLTIFPPQAARPDLYGPRTAGSLTDAGLESLGDRPVTEFRPEVGDVPVARYFRVEAPELNGRLGAVPAGKLTPEQLHLVRTRFVPKHGISLYLDVDPDDADLPSVGYATVILGPINEAGDLGAWTWFPGDCTGTLTVHDREFTDTPANQVGVKLHRGEL